MIWSISRNRVDIARIFHQEEIRLVRCYFSPHNVDAKTVTETIIASLYGPRRCTKISLETRSLYRLASFRDRSPPRSVADDPLKGR